VALGGLFRHKVRKEWDEEGIQVYFVGVLCGLIDQFGGVKWE